MIDQLSRALDYRRWHRFRVERWQDGQWRKLSGPASSGERALGLTVPLFAAVASFYSQGSYALAPRLILLDEAFAGIDDTARAHCMGLIREFDLDFVITSEREWACYAELPGVSICQLQRREGIDAVFVSRWTWDGKAPEHAALASLLGRPQHYANSLPIDVRQVDAAFRNSGIASSLRDALERLDGPIANRASERFQSQALWSDVTRGCQAIPRTYDDSMEESPDEDRQNGERDRDIWAKVGVLVNELARPALFLNLPTSETESYGRPPGEPAYASLRALLRSSPTWNVAGREVYVCENANLLSIAADRWGANCAPMVCTDGMPAAAQRCILSQLTSAGARLQYHGDFDWPGLRIGNHVMREHGAQPWRFRAEDYEVALGAASAIAAPLAGKVVDAVWDPALTKAMQHHRIAIAEEGLAASLLVDLGDY